MNLPRSLNVLGEIKIGNPIACANIQKIVFRMCGGTEAYDRALREQHIRAVAMSVLASGSIAPEEAIEWVCTQPNIRCIVFGASSRSNICATKELVDRYWK